MNRIEKMERVDNTLCTRCIHWDVCRREDCLDDYLYTLEEAHKQFYEAGKRAVLTTMEDWYSFEVKCRHFCEAALIL